MRKLLIPAPRLLQLATLWLLAAAAAALWPDAFGLAWQALGALFLGLLLADAILIGRIRPPQVERRLAGSLAVDAWHAVTLRVSHHGRRALALELHDLYPGDWPARGLPHALDIAPGGWGELRYMVRPIQRGDASFGLSQVRFFSPMRLWQLRCPIGHTSQVKVYPNFAAITRYALLATDNRLSQLGILRRRRRGEGLDFRQLREYRSGDSMRQIDWKATSRLDKLISREYQDERDQQVFFLIDCGRRMSAKDGPLSHFDHALNAALLLAYVGLRQGDAVGLMTMNGPPRFLAPRKSRGMVNLILNTVYDLQPGLAMPDYTRAATELSRRLKKRALIVILSNLRDEDDDTLMPALEMLRFRHLVLLANLREQVLRDTLQAPVRDFTGALSHAATVDYLSAREQAFRRFRGRGAQMLDVEPDRLAVSLVNRYLDIKRGGLL